MLLGWNKLLTSYFMNMVPDLFLEHITKVSKEVLNTDTLMQNMVFDGF